MTLEHGIIGIALLLIGILWELEYIRAALERRREP